MIFKVCVIAVIAVMIAVGFKREHESVSVFILIAATVLLCAFALSGILSTFDELAAIFSYTGSEPAYFKILLKCLGISLLAQMAADLCEDASYSALSSQIILAGKVAVIAMSMPIFNSVLTLALGLIKQ